MRFIVDHDLHIHSQLSLCSGHPQQTTENILKYGEDNGLTTLCLTDHFWDSTVPGASNWYQKQDLAYLSQALPLPVSPEVRFLFGCETDLDRHMTVGISPTVMEQMDFIIIPTTHLHMNGFTCRGDEGLEERIKLWIDRFDGLLDMDLPFHKVGVAHLTCSLMYSNHYMEVLRALPVEEYHRLFAKAAKTGIGIELNFSANHTEEDLHYILLPYRIAKEEGCKFYFGSDAHGPEGLAAAKKNFEAIVDLLELTEDDKFRL